MAARRAVAPPAALPRARRARDLRCRVRRALPRAASSSRHDSPSCAHPTRPRSASGRARPRDSRRCEHLMPMLSLANARDHEALARLGRSGAAAARPARARRGDRLRHGAEDRRARDLARLRDGSLTRGATRGDGDDRRGRHRQPAHDRRAARWRRSAARAPAGARRGARRDLPARSRHSRGSTRSGLAAGHAASHEPAQLGRRLAAPARPARRPPRGRSRCSATPLARSTASRSTRTGARSPGCASTASRSTR